MLALEKVESLDVKCHCVPAQSMLSAGSPLLSVGKLIALRLNTTRLFSQDELSSMYRSMQPRPRSYKSPCAAISI